MPRSHREYLKRYAAEGINDLDRCLDKIMRLKNEYEPHHPEYAKAFENLGFIVVQAREMFDALKIKFM